MKGKACVCSGSAPTGNLSHLEPYVWPEQDFSSNESGRMDRSQPNWTFETQRVFVSDVQCTISNNPFITRNWAVLYVIGLLQFVLV